VIAEKIAVSDGMCLRVGRMGEKPPYGILFISLVVESLEPLNELIAGLYRELQGLDRFDVVPYLVCSAMSGGAKRGRGHGKGRTEAAMNRRSVGTASNLESARRLFGASRTLSSSTCRLNSLHPICGDTIPRLRVDWRKPLD
jgi:hypothetical protein